MTAFPAHPAWDFVTRLYGAPGVAPACLELQERHGIDVTFMLFCLWRGSVCGRPLSGHMPTIAATAKEWHQAVVLPVRAARRRLKATGTSQRPELAALYKTVLSVEIDCEHAELLMLADGVEALCGSADGTASPAAMAENLSAFFAASGVELTSRDRPALTAILKAAGAAGELTRLFP
jgi:uncharacterized protein (TIGR02444 family)